MLPVSSAVAVQGMSAKSNWIYLAFFTFIKRCLLQVNNKFARLFVLLIAACFSGLVTFAQKDSLDLIVYAPLKGWEKKDQKNVRVYTNINRKDKSWCQLGVYKSTVSKGSIEEDVASEWNELVAKPYAITEAPEKSAVEEADGWKVMSASGKFIFKDSNVAVIVTTFSGYGRCVSIVATTSAKRYLNDIVNFVGSVELRKPASSITQPGQISSNDLGPDNVQRNNAFAFNTTNFDDGWTSTVKEDWVEVVKGNVRVLLHYPKEGTVFPADPAPLINAAWNILVAPRYRDLKNYRTAYINTYNRPYFGMGYAKEANTGKDVFVLLFRQGDGWIEFITPDKKSFIQQYKFDPETVQWDTESDLVKPLAAMSSYNKFAVAASDFRGKWTSDFTGIQQLYNVYTGNYAGMNINQSNEEFVFGEGNAYNWKLLVVNGMVGTAKFNQVKSTGTLSVPNNWQVHFTQIENKPKTYNAFWSCIKGARILNLLDAQYPGSGIYTKYGLAK